MTHQPTTPATASPVIEIDDLLGEKLSPGEAELTTATGDELEKQIRQKYTAGNARRDVHAKSPGLLKAEFRVSELLPARLAKGVFLPGKTYQALIRFSKGTANAGESDAKSDSHGMAIKLLDVEGEKILAAAKDARTQDFLLINHPVFFTDDANKYFSFVKKSGGGGLSKLSLIFTLGIRRFLIATTLIKGKIANPLQTAYFSAVPYRLGIDENRVAVKYMVTPVGPHRDVLPGHLTEDYLKQAMIKSLEKGPVEMKFWVQVKKSNQLSVEDSLTEWKEPAASLHEVATIHICKRELNDPELDAWGEKLSFNPWHSLPEHRPLGLINRMRKTVYERISHLRNTMNGVPGGES